MSYKPEMLTPSLPPVWVGNQLCFATHDEAELYGRDLISRWVVPMDYRVVESTDPVNYKRHADGRIERLEDAS